MGNETNNDQIENTDGFLASLNDEEREARSSLQSGSITREDYIAHRSDLLESVNSFLGLEQNLFRLAARMGIVRERVSKEFVRFFSREPYPGVKLRYSIKYNQVWGFVEEARFRRDLLELLQGGATHPETWWEKLQADISYDFLSEENGGIRWMVECSNLIRPESRYVGKAFDAYDASTKNWTIKFDNAASSIEGFRSRFAATIDEMYEEYLRRRVK